MSVHPIMKEAQAISEELVAIRRKLHQIPELGVKLPQTAAFVKETLEKMGIACEVYEDISCVTATIGKGGKCILLRADMDGLPVKEASGEPFASTNGCMHACGHDMHPTGLLGAAKILKAHESELKGTVKFIFQSGEEIFAGAKAAIEHGLMENPKVDVAFGMHVFGSDAAGMMRYGHKAMTSVYGFRITLTGKGTHGSTPELGVDPIYSAVQVYLGLQELIAREVPAMEEVVLTIGRLEAGKVSNVIPNEAVMEGTLRTFNPEMAKYLTKRISEVAEGIAKTYRTELKLETLSYAPATICDMDFTKECIDSIHTVDADMQISDGFKAMGSEDFAFYAEKVSAAFFAIGAGVDDKSKWRSQHNPGIVFNEAVLPRMAAIYAQVAIDWLKNHR